MTIIIAWWDRADLAACRELAAAPAAAAATGAARVAGDGDEQRKRGTGRITFPPRAAAIYGAPQLLRLLIAVPVLLQSPYLAWTHLGNEFGNTMAMLQQLADYIVEHEIGASTSALTSAH